MTAMDAATDLRSEINNLSATLNKESDDLTEAITNFDRYLIDLRLGVIATAPISSSTWEDPRTGEAGSEETLLCFTKEEPYGWGLYIITEGDDGHDGQGGRKTGSMRRLRDAPRDERVAAVKHFPALLETIKAIASKELNDVRDARKQAEEFLAQLKITK